AAGWQIANPYAWRTAPATIRDSAFADQPSDVLFGVPTLLRSLAKREKFSFRRIARVSKVAKQFPNYSCRIGRDSDSPILFGSLLPATHEFCQSLHVSSLEAVGRAGTRGRTRPSRNHSACSECRGVCELDSGCGRSASARLHEVAA